MVLKKKTSSHIFHTLCSYQRFGSFAHKVSTEGQVSSWKTLHLSDKKNKKKPRKFSSVLLYCKLYWHGFILWYLSVFLFCFFCFNCAPQYITSQSFICCLNSELLVAAETWLPWTQRTATFLLFGLIENRNTNHWPQRPPRVAHSSPEALRDSFSMKKAAHLALCLQPSLKLRLLGKEQRGFYLFSKHGSPKSIGTFQSFL